MKVRNRIMRSSGRVTPFYSGNHLRPVCVMAATRREPGRKIRITPSTESLRERDRDPEFTPSATRIDIGCYCFIAVQRPPQPSEREKTPPPPPPDRWPDATVVTPSA